MDKKQEIATNIINDVREKNIERWIVAQKAFSEDLKELVNKHTNENDIVFTVKYAMRSGKSFVDAEFFYGNSSSVTSWIYDCLALDHCISVSSS